MRFNEFNILNEIAMSPSSLRKAVSSINATCGIEFEMIFKMPDLDSLSDDLVQYDVGYNDNIVTGSLEQALRATTLCLNEYNNNYNLIKLVTRLMSLDYQELRQEKMQEIDEKWKNTEVKTNFIKQYFKYNILDDDMRRTARENTSKIMINKIRENPEEFSSSLSSAYDDDTPLLDFFDYLMDEPTDSNAYKLARKYYLNQLTLLGEEWYNKQIEASSYEEFDNQLKDYFMQWEDQDSEDFLYKIYGGTSFKNNIFPKLLSKYENTYPDLHGVIISKKIPNVDNFFKLFAESLGKKLNKSVQYARDYHSSRKRDNYIIETDSSIKPYDKSDISIELISPPISINDFLKDFNKIIEWAKENNFYTNNSTGLHMNISIDEYEDSDNVDYIKLILLSGDQYVLEQFGREANSYCKSALTKIVNAAMTVDNALLANLNHKFLKVASSYIYNHPLGRNYTSVDIRGKYVEFRGPGGNWLDKNLSHLEDTLFRYVVALDAALDKDKYKYEYYKKFYKLLTSAGWFHNDEILNLIAKYKANIISLSDLKTGLRLQRTSPSRPKLP